MAESKDAFLWTMDPDGGNPFEVSAGGEASWSPDGSRLVFSDDRGDIYVVNSDGTGLRRLTHLHHIISESPTFSPDGNQVAYTRHRVGRRSGPVDIWIMDADGSSQGRFTDTPRKWKFTPSWQAT